VLKVSTCFAKVEAKFLEKNFLMQLNLIHTTWNMTDTPASLMLRNGVSPSAVLCARFENSDLQGKKEGGSDRLEMQV
jgi:hypothetical protein